MLKHCMGTTKSNYSLLDKIRTPAQNAFGPSAQEAEAAKQYIDDPSKYDPHLLKSAPPFVIPQRKRTDLNTFTKSRTR